VEAAQQKVRGWAGWGEARRVVNAAIRVPFWTVLVPLTLHRVALFAAFGFGSVAGEQKSVKEDDPNARKRCSSRAEKEIKPKK
jgi:hypothetical protein